MSIVVVGACGQLGSEFCRRLGIRRGKPGGSRESVVHGLTIGQLDITDDAAVRRMMADLRPTTLINAAAYTNVDRAEDEPDPCRAVNAFAVGQLAAECRELGCQLVHVSTDYVFGADRQRTTPYRETDAPGPLSVYAQTKLEGEQYAAECPRHFIVRTCGLYGPGSAGPGHNFVETVLRLANDQNLLRVVDDQVCTPTYTRDVVRAVVRLLDTSAYGLYHVVNSGSTTWCRFASRIISLAGLRTTVTPIQTHEYPRRAVRPNYSVLDTTKYESVTGDRLPDWETALADFLAQ